MSGDTGLVRVFGRKMAAFAFASGLVGAGAPALAEDYKCAVAELGQVSNYIGQETYISVATDGTQVQVNDGLIQHYLGGPISVKVTENTDTRLVFRWNIDITNEGVQTTRMAYRATLFRDTGSLRVYAKPAGYDNDFEGRGTCKKV